jgi:hypothetical protein
MSETLEIVGPAGKIVIDAADLQEWKDRGYTPAGEEATPACDPEPVCVPEPEEEDEDVEEYDDED